jgi:hypothetical protein
MVVTNGIFDAKIAKTSPRPPSFFARRFATFSVLCVFALKIRL